MDGLQALIDKSCIQLREGNLKEGIETLEHALSVDFENQSVVALLKCAHFWRERNRNALELRNTFERAEYLLNQLRVFRGFAEKNADGFEDTQSIFKQYVCTTCLGLYNAFLGENTGVKDPDVFLRLGKCYKGTGEYDKALHFLEAAYQLRKDDAAILGELADCYAMINETQKSKAFFREAFFINPQAVDVQGLESSMMQRLVDRVRSSGYVSPVLEEWMPVYGVICGIFSIKRELRSIEYGKLKQAIYAMEVELREGSGGSSKEVMIPRLLYRYFWLIDHYLSVKEDRERIHEVLLKIKNLNRDIYEQYTK
jgi:tetratricopeptide (TPR) repeat protein